MNEASNRLPAGNGTEKTTMKPHRYRAFSPSTKGVQAKLGRVLQFLIPMHIVFQGW
jgi:hypothetical protein